MECALASLPAGEVITQVLTCITAVNPILSAGHTPVYCDISVDNFSINTAKLAEHVGPNTKAVVMQHTLGMEADVLGARQALGQNQVLLLEDSAHCLGYIAKDNGQPIADVSVHSFGAEKLLSTRFGAAVWVNPAMANSQLGDALVASFQKLPRMGLVVSTRVRLYPVLNGVLNRLPGSISNGVRKLLLATKLFRSPIVPAEQRGQNYESPQRMSKAVARKVSAAMKDLLVNMEHRAMIAQLYGSSLQGAKFAIPAALVGSVVCVRFPLLAPSAEVADEFFRNMRAKGYAIGKWYRPLLFPGPDSYDTYHYTMGSCPVAEDVSARIINLPTGPDVTEKTAKDIVDEIRS